MKANNADVFCALGYIQLRVDGHEIIVELCQSDEVAGSHIDILVKGSEYKSKDETVEFVMKHVIDKIREFCASPRGCPGVTLVLGIIRTQCVLQLIPYGERDNQVIRVELLTKKLQEDVEVRLKENDSHYAGLLRLHRDVNSLLNYEHAWPEVPGLLGPEHERVADLLWESEVERILRSVHDNLACESHDLSEALSSRGRDRNANSGNDNKRLSDFAEDRLTYQNKRLKGAQGHPEIDCRRGQDPEKTEVATQNRRNLHEEKVEDLLRRLVNLRTTRRVETKFLRENDKCKVSRLSDEVYEVYTPLPEVKPTAELVFVHGLHRSELSNEPHLNVWSTRDDPTMCWLNTWLASEFPLARILSVTYDTSTQKTSNKGRLDMYLTGENLAHSLVKVAHVGQECPVVLVGHSLGGQVLKEICLNVRSHELEERRDPGPDCAVYTRFLSSVKGIFVFSTPQKGSFSKLLDPASLTGFMGAQKSDLIKSFDVLDGQAARKNEQFRRLRDLHGWETAGVVESNETEVEVEAKHMHLDLSLSSSSNEVVSGKFKEVVVTEASARGEGFEIQMIRDTDHFTICRPATRTSDVFQSLANFIEKVTPEIIRCRS